MKKLVCVLSAILIMASGLTVSASDLLIGGQPDFNKGVIIDRGSACIFGMGTYIGYKNVDLTGMNSVTAKGNIALVGGLAGETLRVMIDDPISGKQIGEIIIWEEKESFTASIEPTNGTHDVYFAGTYGRGIVANFRIESFEFSKDTYTYDPKEKQVPDSLIKDFHADAWTATDGMGRKVADYSETGGVKGDRYVGMLYWDWHNGQGTMPARIISEITNKYPEAMEDSGHEAWSGMASYYWDEPVYGFYSSYDYWVYRRHAELFAASGVDFLILDHSNAGPYAKPMLCMAQAFRDAKKDGVAAPRISSFVGWQAGGPGSLLNPMGTYNIFFKQEDFSDLWFYWRGKPLLFGFDGNDVAGAVNRAEDELTKKYIKEIHDFFTWRKNDKDNTDHWIWLESFPQKERGISDGMRPEFMALSLAISESYVLGKGVPYVMSDKYAKGRGYSAVFGEDYSENGARTGQYFAEQASLVLESDPELIFVDGWNEFTAGLATQYQGFAVAFPDTFDSENSRDFEPVKGLLKDDYYMLLTDFIRKYKGIRPAETAGKEKSIDINEGAEQWQSVTPLYMNYTGQDRDSLSGNTDKDGNVFRYITEKTTRITESRVSRDAAKLYFMAKSDKEIEKGDGVLALYINTDRNPATGLNGYDFVIGRNAMNAVESIASDGTYTTVGEAELSVSGDLIQMAIPRSMIDETGTADFEFKWISGKFTDVIELYSDLNTAPIGRFNYLYTEIPQKALTVQERNSLTDSAVLRAGSGKMIVDGGIQTVCEADTARTPIEMNGTLYIPAKAFEEIIGYGRSKTEYDSYSDIFYFSGFSLDDSLQNVTNVLRCYSVIGSMEARVNGRLKTLTAPIAVIDGMIYLPISLFSECFERSVTTIANGAYLIGESTAAAANSALHYIAE